MSKAIAMFIILMFLAHPNIVQYMLYNFKCIDIDGEMRMKEDLEILCWTGTHKIFSMFVALPAIVAWGFGMPFLAFLLLTRVRNSLEKS